jgi:putative hydrolases of HD superfamily
MTAIPSEAIGQQLAFLAELDQLKSVTRQSPLVNRSRKENSAEHSWHLALFALVLAEHVEDIDPYKVVRMLLIHDVVEIDAGDVPIHLVGADRDALAQAERKAAERIFGLLPPKQGEKFLSLWLEFEAGATRDACFAKALDRFQPLFLNTLTGGGTWTESGVTEEQVLERYGPTIERGSPALWNEAKRLVRQHFESARAA